MAGVKFYT